MEEVVEHQKQSVLNAEDPEFLLNEQNNHKEAWEEKERLKEDHNAEEFAGNSGLDGAGENKGEISDVEWEDCNHGDLGGEDGRGEGFLEVHDFELGYEENREDDIANWVDANQCLVDSIVFGNSHLINH